MTDQEKMDILDRILFAWRQLREARQDVRHLPSCSYTGSLEGGFCTCGMRERADRFSRLEYRFQEMMDALV